MLLGVLCACALLCLYPLCMVLQAEARQQAAREAELISSEASVEAQQAELEQQRQGLEVRCADSMLINGGCHPVDMNSGHEQ